MGFTTLDKVENPAAPALTVTFRRDVLDWTTLTAARVGAMAPLVKRKPEVAFSGEIGRQAVIFDDEDIVRLLRDAVELEGAKPRLQGGTVSSARASMRFYRANGQ